MSYLSSPFVKLKIYQDFEPERRYAAWEWNYCAQLQHFFLDVCSRSSDVLIHQPVVLLTCAHPT